MGIRVAAVFATVLGMAGCPDEDGNCAYDENTFRDVEVTIASIEPDPGGWLVTVEGEVEFTFEFNDHDYELCVAGMGLEVGDEAPVQVLDGGRCPTEYRIGVCDGYT